MVTFDNITLVPRVVSEKQHRSECSTSSEFCGVHLDTPLIASPMPDVCNGMMALELAELGCLGIIHRFQPIMDQLKEFKMAKWTDPMLKLQSTVHKFFDAKLLTFRNNNKEIFFNTASNKKKMATVPYGEDPYEYAAQFLQSDEGLDALKMLENNLELL